MGGRGEDHLRECLELIEAGQMRVDGQTGMVHQTFTTSLYQYERPVGVLTVSGYVAISLGARRSVYAHRLVWAANHGIPEPGLVVNHINGVKRDNRLANLELVTNAGNIQHAYRTGLIPRGEQHYSAKLTDRDAALVREAVHSGVRRVLVARAFGCSVGTIDSVMAGRGRYALEAV